MDANRPAIDECFNPQHMILPVELSTAQWERAPRRTLCVSCLTAHLDRLSVPQVEWSLQHVTFALQCFFSPVFVKRRAGPRREGSLPHTPADGQSSPPSWDLLSRFAGTLQELGGKVCFCVLLHRQTPLYRAGLSLLVLLFALLKEGMESNLFCRVECLGAGGCGGSLTVLEPTVPSSLPPVGLSTLVCESALTALRGKAESATDGMPFAMPVLLLTDLAEASFPFLCSAAEHGISYLSALTEALTDAFRVELLLYLHHQVFEVCAKHPVWLEDLAGSLPGSLWGPQRRAFLVYLSWSLETFRGEEPVVVNSLYLARFVLQYRTTRTAVFGAFHSHAQVASGERGCGSEGGCLSLGEVLAFVRNLTLLLLHLNGDVVVAAAETLAELLKATQLFGECPDVVDYVIEALRTASADTAPALVGILNTLPCAGVPYGPLLCVMFEAASTSGKAFEDAVRGPHFVAALADPHTNINDTAQKIVCTVQGERSVSFHCFLLECLCLEQACRTDDGGGALLLPETFSILANALVRLVGEFCGKVMATTEEGDNLIASQQPRLGEFPSVPGEVLYNLTCVVAFLLPNCKVSLVRLAIDLLGELLSRFLGSSECVPSDGRLLFDPCLSDAVLVLGSVVIQHLVGRGCDCSVTENKLEQRVCCLLRNNLLTMLFSVPSSLSELRVCVANDFLLLAPANRGGPSECNQLCPSFLVGADSPISPRVLLTNSMCCNPRWAASFLLALAVTGCEQPLGDEELHYFLLEELSFVTRFTEEAQQALALGRPSRFGGTGDVLREGNDCSVAEVSALKISAAIFKWRREQPRRDIAHLGACVLVSNAPVTPEELRPLYLSLFRFAEPEWLAVLGSCVWGRTLLAALVSNTVVQLESNRLHECVGDAHVYLFCGSQRRGKEDIALCSLVVNHSAGFGLFLVLLFSNLRRFASSCDCSLSCRIITFLCRCVHSQEASGTPTVVEFCRTVLEQYVTPLLLYTEASPRLVGHIARLVVLLLYQLPPSVAGCCDHTLFRWALQYVKQSSGQVYVWLVIFFLLKRAHGIEFALRHEAELRAQLCCEATDLSQTPCVAAARATVRWVVEGEMMRYGVCRSLPIVKIPLSEWSQCSSENLPLRAFVICHVVYRMRWCWCSAMDRCMAEAAPLLLGWVNEMMFHGYETVAAARLCYETLKKFPHLSSSLEVLGLFLLLTRGEVSCGQLAKKGEATTSRAGAAESAWVLAALLSAWPAWAEAAGLRAAVDTFLGLAEEPTFSRGMKRTRACDSPAPCGAANTERVNRPPPDVCEAVRSIVEACESQEGRCGPFPLNRAKDFYLRWPTETARIDMESDVVFRVADGGGELMVTL